jgi:nicotinate-nucleotide adenylyltransferase
MVIFVPDVDGQKLGSLTAIGYFGGTFDPVHIGHVGMALELKQACRFDEMYLLPCRYPPHRPAPSCSDQQRLHMVSLAVAEHDHLQADGRELNRAGLSYTIDTLIELRRELGDNISLSWCVGLDSLVNITTWHRWRELLDYAHLVVVDRPGWCLPEVGEVIDWLQQNRATPDILHSEPSGKVIIQPLSLIDVSATDIRGRIKAKKSVQFLLPDAVWRYVNENRFYQTNMKSQND